MAVKRSFEQFDAAIMLPGTDHSPSAATETMQ
jgi:hypothetical protein